MLVYVLVDIVKTAENISFKLIFYGILVVLFQGFSNIRRLKVFTVDTRRFIID